MGPSISQGTNRGLVIGIVVVLCIVCALVLAMGGGAFFFVRNFIGSAPDFPKPNDASPTPPPTVEVHRPNAGAISTETESTLAKTVLPETDLYDLACRLRNVCNVPHQLPAPATPFRVGDQQKFWLQNTDTSKNFQVDATLRYITPHSYFWLQNGVSVSNA
ncbi:MAG: hypothetical protein ACM3MF_07705 [Anaerolineae bacterium]